MLEVPARLTAVLALLGAPLATSACGGSAMNDGVDQDGQDGSDADDVVLDANANALDAHAQDPDDPVEEVPAHSGIYTFGKLTTDDFLGASSGTYFTNDKQSVRISTTRVTYARHRDAMVLKSKIAEDFFIYDGATQTLGDAHDLPSDAIGEPVIRGGVIYVGGNAKLYSYEIATDTWRSRTLAGTGACHHVVASATRLFALCSNLATPDDDDVFSTWANLSMSDVTTIGTVAPGQGAMYGWIAAAPGTDVAYFGSRASDPGCVARATWNAVEPCAFSLRTITPDDTAFTFGGQASEDGALLYVESYDDDGRLLYEVALAAGTATSLGHIDSYATCPDNSVVWQDFVTSKRRAGGVTTDVQLGSGGENDMGCPLVKVP